jgi:diguanylate cyclase (GGDEF)-like protein
MRKKIVSRNVADYLVKESVRDIDYILGFIDRLKKNQSVKLLVADDSPSYRHMVSSFLRVHKFEVLEANDGVHALEMLNEHPDIQLVVADYKMPRMDGFELVTKIRRKFAKDEIGFVGLSAHDQESLSAKFLKKGANDFLSKPFSKEEFFCRIRQNIELIELTRKVRESAQRDYLTGLHNRPYLMEMGEKYFENAQRNNLAITIALIDIDGFQAINEKFGLDAGDAVIRQVAAQIERSLRGTDIIARFDAGEFGVVAVNLSDELARMVFERVRKNVAECAFDYEGRELHATVSIGATNLFAESLPEMLNSSHESLVEAKNAGRDCVVWSRRKKR